MEACSKNFCHLAMLVACKELSYISIEVSTRELPNYLIDDTDIHFKCQIDPAELAWPVRGCDVWVGQYCDYKDRQKIVDALLKAGAESILWWDHMDGDKTYSFGR